MQRALSVLACLLAMTLISSSYARADTSDRPAEEKEAADSAEHRNVLQWTTATEVDNYGYDVYRGVSEDGPFDRLNDSPIPGAGTTDEPTSYTFIDEDVDPYQTYWYYLESISMKGERERFSPVFRKKAKLPRDED